MRSAGRPSDGKPVLNRIDTNFNRPPEYDWRNDPAFAPDGTSPRQHVPQPIPPAQLPPVPQQHANSAPVQMQPAAKHEPEQVYHEPQQRPEQRPPAPPPNGAPNEGIRSLAEFERARRHSQRVRFLRKALPFTGIAAVVILAAVLAFTVFSGPSIDLGSARFEDGKLVMRNPELSGTDENRRPYNLRADKAIQDSERPTRIELRGITAKLPMTDTDFAAVQAGNGIYDADAKTLVLGGKVAVDTDTGMAIRMEDADIDIASGQMRTRNEVSVDTGRAKVTADALTVSENGKVIVFENRVRMTIMPAGESAEAAALRPAQPVLGD